VQFFTRPIRASSVLYIRTGWLLCGIKTKRRNYYDRIVHEFSHNKKSGLYIHTEEYRSLNSMNSFDTSDETRVNIVN